MMDENKFASPAEVNETLAPEETWRRKAGQLRFAAWGMVLVSWGFAQMLMAVSVSLVSREWKWKLLDFLVDFNMIRMLAAIIGVGMFVLGMALCLACGKNVIRHGRWLILAALGCICVPPLSDFFVSAYWTYENAIIFAGFTFWSVFLWLMAWALKIPHCRFWLGLTFLLWATAVFWSVMLNAGFSFFRDFNDYLFPLIYYRLGVEQYTYVAGCVTCIVGMLILRASIVKQLRKMHELGGDERNEE